MTAAAIKERPILFSGELVRAILDGRKTQTRRIVKPQPVLEHHADLETTLWKTKSGWGNYYAMRNEIEDRRCPFGQPGDQLWVRERIAWNRLDDSEYCYYADKDAACHYDSTEWRSTPAIHMPRKLCRITLEITSVLVEQLVEMKAAGVVAEGYPFSSDLDQFKTSWNKRYAKDGNGWDANPWVWCISFTRVTAPPEPTHA